MATLSLWRVLWWSLVGGAGVVAVCWSARSFGATWQHIRRGLLSVYAIAYVVWTAREGIVIDRVSVLWTFAIFLVLASVGRTWTEWLRTARDLGVFVVMWLAYDESRGVADRLGMPVQVESVRDIDRFLLVGNDGVVWLQQNFLAPVGTVRWYDVVGSCVYYSHFVVPPFVMAVLWLRDRDQWVRYMRRFATVIAIACAMFVLVPTAPPWMAAGGRNRSGYDFDALPPLRRPTGNGLRHIGLDVFVGAWDTGRDWANDVAAMPSLHSAYALFVVAFFWPRIRRRSARFALVLYPLTMASSLMYFAEHYLIDALAGWAIVGLSFAVWRRVETRQARHDLEESTFDADAATAGEMTGVATQT